jgi:hypothetical protein
MHFHGDKVPSKITVVSFEHASHHFLVFIVYLLDVSVKVISAPRQSLVRPKATL